MQHFSRYQCVFHPVSITVNVKYLYVIHVIYIGTKILFASKWYSIENITFASSAFAFWEEVFRKKFLSHLFTSLFHFIKFVWSFSRIIYTKAFFLAKLPGYIRDCCSSRIRLVSFSSDHCLVSSPFYCFSSFTMFLSRNQWNECPLYHNIYCIIYFFSLLSFF